jgi:hypothetical protein
VEFRTQATLNLLAFKWEAHRRFAKKCATMLKTFGRYDKQNRFQHDAKKKAMSPRIFTDMQRRNVDTEFDRLPIIANSCNSAIRFVSQKISKEKHDLDLCLLTMALLNGELLRDSRDIKKLPAEMDITNYMQYMTFNKFDPPVTKRRLSYLKACRLHSISLQRAGIGQKAFYGPSTIPCYLLRGPVASKEPKALSGWSQRLPARSLFSLGGYTRHLRRWRPGICDQKVSRN